MRLYIRNKEKYDPSKVGRALVFVEFPDPRVFSVGQVKEVIIIFVFVFHWRSEKLLKPLIQTPKDPFPCMYMSESKERSCLS